MPTPKDSHHDGSPTTSHHAFSLIELLATIMVLSMIGMAMGPTLQKMRSTSQGLGSAANLQAIGTGAAMYANANNARMFSYSWKAGETYIMPDGREKTVFDDVTASQYQNQSILQLRSGRITGPFKIQREGSSIPHRRYNHLVLYDFLSTPSDSTLFIDPADTNQLNWHANELDYGTGSSVPYANDTPAGYDQSHDWSTNAIRQRWAFASSYQTVPSSWQQDYPLPRYRPVLATPHLFAVSGNPTLLNLNEGRAMNELLFPANKVWMHEEFDREAEGDPYFAYDHARSEKLMFDGSVNNWRSRDAYPAVIPEDSFPYEPWTQAYVPLDTFPVPLGGLGDSARLNQRYRWTFRGLIGVDYGPGNPDGR
ncbi:MAG: type II secretion system protein [Phycisphaerales bacterium]